MAELGIKPSVQSLETGLDIHGHAEYVIKMQILEVCISKCETEHYYVNLLFLKGRTNFHEIYSQQHCLHWLFS